MRKAALLLAFPQGGLGARQTLPGEMLSNPVI
jgi:hypothetical protein